MKRRIEMTMTWFNSILNGTTHTPREQTIHNYVKKSLSVIVITNIIVVILSTFNQFNTYSGIFLPVAYISTLVFTVEYLLRLYSAPIKRSNMHKMRARLGYATSFMGIVDFITIIPFIIQHVHILEADYEILSEVAKIFLVLKLARYSDTFKFIVDALRSVRLELTFGITVGLSIILFSGMLMYYVERDAQPEVFYNVGQGLWWSVITFTTVGYGDMAPATGFGKLLAGLIAMVGIGMLALPTGIISSTFIKRMNEMRDQRTQKNNKKPQKNSEATSKNDNKIEQTNYCPHCGARLRNDKHE
ncbi:MAG: ion transporter [Rikenellaceae bacterium]